MRTVNREKCLFFGILLRKIEENIFKIFMVYIYLLVRGEVNERGELIDGIDWILVILDIYDFKKKWVFKKNHLNNYHFSYPFHFFHSFTYSHLFTSIYFTFF